MARKLSERTQAVLFLVVLCVAIAGLYGWIVTSQPRPVQAEGVTAVSLTVEGPNWTIHYAPPSTTNNTAFGLLLEASRHLHFALTWVNYTIPSGVFVTSINGTANGQGGSSWQYWVSGVYGNEAASLYPLHSGDTDTWRFTTDQGAPG